ncbi:NF-kappa-B inhibitor delta isoform X2 [Lampris incognitus]|uniref:NF-kappa-B inhibitor delta isoform X2 n=1 Tax=Lampris incognitus TaxID=2546036 RepID=UPI0024B55630|nr:NF-kappa-B inhibitor delta isoform X2 [Lampris incognitus]
MHWEKSPKEKSCYTLSTVKKLLEQKRKRETSSGSPSGSTASASPVPAAAVPQVSTAEPATSTGASSSYSDMAVGYQQWGAMADSAEPFSFYATSTSVGYGPTCSPPMATGYSTQQQTQGYGNASMSQNYQVCPVTAADPSLSASGTALGSILTPQLSFGLQMDPAKLEEARMFLQGMDYNKTTSQDEDGDTILHIYTAKGLREWAFAAAERLKDCGQLDAKEHKGKTALLVAVTANQPDIIQDLMLFGADVNACDFSGQTALHLAAEYGFPEVIQVILSSHAVNLETRNFEGMTPLHCAAISHCEVVKGLSASRLLDAGLQAKAGKTRFCLQILLNNGASLLSQEIKSNKTVLHLAVKEGNIDLVRHLLNVPLSNMRDFVNMKAHGHTPLHMAAGLHGNPHQEEILRLLLSNGADPSIRNLENDQAAHLLQSGPQGEQLKLILKRRSTSTRRRVMSLQDKE